MPIEPRRGCGYRRVGVLYLIGSGLAKPCPNMPLPLESCPICGFKPQFYRDFMWIAKSYIMKLVELYGDPEADDPGCPLCDPQANNQDRYGFMWVGRKFYTPESFVEEAMRMGVSKAIKQIPRGLKLGETWVLLAHPDAVRIGVDDEGKPIAKSGIFYAFRPIRIEMLVYESEADDETLRRLKERGITPVIVPDSERKYHRRKIRRSRKSRIDELIEEEDEDGDERDN